MHIRRYEEINKYILKLKVILIINSILLFVFVIQWNSMGAIKKWGQFNNFIVSNEFAGKIIGFVALDEKNLFVIEQYGEIPNLRTRILQSTNGGEKWREKFSVTAQDFHKIYFFDNKIGFTSASLGEKVILYRTMDGGESWVKINNSIPSNVNEIQFIDENQGYILCENGYFLQTFDGGKTWKNIKSFQTEMTSFRFFDDITGWILSQKGEVFSTQDGGKTWKSETENFKKMLKKWDSNEISFVKFQITNSKEGYLGVRFKTLKEEKNDSLNLTETYAVYDGGVIFRTKDSGVTWNLSLVTEEKGLVDFFAFNPSNIWVIPGYIWRKPGYFLSLDDGKSWKNEPFKGNLGDPFFIFFVNNKVGWILTSGGSFDYLYQTWDGGKTWK